MEKHQTEKIRKIKAIPDRRIDFYYRLLKGPEQLKRRKKQRITAALVIAAFLAAGHVIGVLKHSEKEYQKTIAKLEAFLEDETNQAADKSAQKLGDQVEKQDNMIYDMENAKANIYSYPLVTSDVFKTLEDCCPDKVLITITGYNCATGELQFDAVAPEVTDVSEVQQEALEMQQLQMQVHIAALPVDEKRDEEQKKQLAELESHFFPYQTNEELNRYLTDVFVSEGMIMQDSTLRAGQLDEITPYSLSERMALLKKNEQAKQTQTGINVSADSKKDEIDTKTEYVYSAQADYTAIGTKNQALAVLDQLSEKEGVRIVSFSISDAAVKTTNNGQDVLQAGKRLEVSMMIYMTRGSSDGK